MKKRKRDYRFRVTYRKTVRGSGIETEASFSYPYLRLARKNYKAILNGLYRSKDVGAFAICLNRCKDPKWRKVIHQEKGEGDGQQN